MFESKINRGRANGYAPLDGSGKVPLDKLPPIQSTIDTGSFITNNQTGSFATTGSNIFVGDQTISGSLTATDFIQTSTLQGTGSLFLKPDSTDNRHFEIYNTSPSDTHIKANGGLSFFGDDTNYLKINDASETVTIQAHSDILLETNSGNVILNPDGRVYVGSNNAGNEVVTDGDLYGIIGDTNVVNNSTGNTITDNLNRITSSLNTSTASLQTIISKTGSFATTGSNSFNGNQTINGDLILSSSNVPTTLIGSDGDIKGTLKIDHNAIYFASQSYVPETYQITVNPGTTYNTHVSIPKNQGIPELYSNGWSITTQDDTTYILTGVYSDGDNWDCEIDSLNSNYNGGTQTMELRWLDYVATDIWKKIDFGFERGKFVENEATSSIVKRVSVPTSLTGSEGDRGGTIAFDSGAIYFANDSYYGTGPFTTSLYQNMESSPNFPITKGNFPKPKIGWTVSWQNGIQTATVTNVVEYTNYWLVYTNGGNSSIPASTTVTLIANGLFDNVWLKQEFISSSIINSLNSKTGSYATTGSNNFNGNQIITGSISITNVITGSITNAQTASYVVQAQSASYWSGSIINATSASYALTASYALNGGGGTVDTSSLITTSSFNDYTSSINNRTGSFALTSSINTLTSSFVSFSSSINSFTSSINTYTASINARTSSFATTGSNQFNGNQTITGSLNVSTLSVVSSSFTTNNSSLNLTSGSNLYVRNNGIAEITGSLIVTGSITISTGSITMPNRPAFRVTGAGGGKASVTVLSGSYLNVDYQQGGGWDNSTGTFTAPIAGLYQVNLVTRTNSNTLGTISQLVVFKNNTSGTNGTTQIMVEFAPSTSMNHTGGSTISKLAVGDTLKMVVAAGEISFDANDNFSVAYIG
jgi:hypothetical protein